MIFVQHDAGPDSGMSVGDEAFDIIDRIASFDKPLIFRADRELMEKYKLDIRDMESGDVANICGLNNAGIVISKGKIYDAVCIIKVAKKQLMFY